MVDVCKCTDERWLPVVGMAMLYLVSSCGRVWSLGRTILRSNGQFVRIKPKMMTLRPQEYGHLIVTLTPLEGKMIAAKVHRLVAMAFIGEPPEGKPHCCHYDGNPQNNHVSNLRWDTAKANAADSLRHGTHTQASKTVCPRGHLLVEPNLLAGLFRRTGKRKCLACSRVWNQERAAEREGRQLVGTSDERADAQYRRLMSGQSKRMPQNSKKLTAAQVREIKLALAVGKTQDAIAAQFDIKQTTVSDIKRGRTWTSVTT